MSNIHTRPATENDVFAMEQVMRDAFGESFAHFMPEQYVREWYDTNGAERAVRIGLQWSGVAEIMGRVVGFVTYEDHSITQLWVAPEHQGKGAGRALIEWVEGEFRKIGFPTITIYCHEANANGLEFLKKMRCRRASKFFSNDITGGTLMTYNMLKMVSKLKG